MGPFYSRPLEVVFDRYAGNFKQSQPPHLRHLAIIRDTEQKKKTYHFQYFTHANFQKRVDSGEASWESVDVTAKPAKSKSRKTARQAEESIKYDEYGFEIIPQIHFAHKDGDATLGESLAAGKIKDVCLTSFDPVILKDAQGNESEFVFPS